MDRSDDDPTRDVATIESPTLVPAPRPDLVTAPTGRIDRASRPSLPGYELGPAIGIGGMGEVLLAHDPELDRDVAIKRLRAASPREDEIARFLREARIQARLDHPA